MEDLDTAGDAAVDGEVAVPGRARSTILWRPCTPRAESRSTTNATSWDCGPAAVVRAAKYWLQVLTEIKNRGVEDVWIVVCDGLKGLPDAIDATWPLAVVQTCVLHLHRQHVPVRIQGRLGHHGQRPPARVHRCLGAGR